MGIIPRTKGHHIYALNLVLIGKVVKENEHTVKWMDGHDRLIMHFLSVYQQIRKKLLKKTIQRQKNKPWFQASSRENCIHW